MLLCSALLAGASLQAQTLARPGWAGSGLTSQTWWRAAVVYRVQPESFQDSDGDGVGDLRGLAQRLDYLQSIGVDAVLLQSHADEPAFDDLLSDASRHHIRILVQLGGHATSPTPRPDAILNEARNWLRRGVAGVYVPAPMINAIAQRSFRDGIFLVHELRSIADSFPGERIVITGDSPVAEAQSEPGHHDNPELVDGLVTVSNWDAATLRTHLALANSSVNPEPLLQIEQPASVSADAKANVGRDKILAALLLSARGAVALPYGEEIGLDTVSSSPVMRWTPTNITRPQAAVAASNPNEIHYGPYRPYVPPLPSTVMGPRPALPKAELDTTVAPPPVDPDRLPGFTTRTTGAPVVRPQERMLNVAAEDNDPESLLNFYRRVLELHSGNATLRSGSVTFLDHDGEAALVWLRRAPTGARTVASAVVACNLTDHPIELSLDSDFERLHLAPGVLRPLLTSVHADHYVQPTHRLRLSPHSVFVGELYMGGSEPHRTRRRR
ncbi:MAG TPA: hypothetical protein VLI45_02835 [Acidobacteriaceae bacterium]|nr:hypothetical protein [Acidobacteriaceae bacterium]